MKKVGKTIGRKILLSILVLFSFVSFLFYLVVSKPATKNSTLVLAEATNVDPKIAEFEKKISALESEINAEGFGSSVDNAVASDIANAINAYNRVATTIGTDDISAEALSLYAKIQESRYGKIDVMNTAINGMFNYTDGTWLVYYSLDGEVSNLETQLSAVEGNDDENAFLLMLSEGDTARTTIDRVREKVDAIGAKIATAKTAIENIYVSGYEAEIVWSLSGKITDARAAVNAIYEGYTDAVAVNAELALNLGDIPTGASKSYIELLEDAEAGIDALEAKIEAVEQDISEVNTLVTSNGNAYYTYKTEIYAAKEAFDLLPDDINNNLKDEVSNYNVIENLLEQLGRVDGLLTTFVTEVSEIGTVLYTDASNALIEDAENAFDALDADVKALIIAEDTKASEYFDDYATMTTARSTYTTLDNDVSSLQNRIEVIGEKEGADLVDEYWDCLDAYNAMTAHQQEHFKEGYTTTYKGVEYTYRDVLTKVISDINAEKAKGDVVVAKITNLGGVDAVKVYNYTFKTDLENVESEYGLLSETAKYFVNNKADLFAMRAEYNAKRDATDAVQTLIVGLTTKYSYEINLNVNAGDIKADIAAINNAIAGLAADQVEAINNEVYTELSLAYGVILQHYVGAETDEDALVTAAINAIDAIGTVEFTVDCGNKIYAAKVAYDAVSELFKQYVTNSQTFDDATGIFEGFVEDAQPWVNEVNGYTNEQEGINIIGIPSEVTITAEGEIVQAEDAWAVLCELRAEDADYLEAVKAYYSAEYNIMTVARETLETIKTNIKGVANAMNAIPELVNAGEGANDWLVGEKLEAFLTAYAGVKAAYEDLSDDDKAYLQANYEDAYAKYTAAGDTAPIAEYAKKVVELDASIGGVENVKLANAGDISNLYNEYLGLEEAQKQVLIDNGVATIIEDYEAKRQEVVASFEQWITDVDNFVSKTALKASLDEYDALMGRYDNLTAGESTDEEEYLANAKAKLEEYCSPVYVENVVDLAQSTGVVFEKLAILQNSITKLGAFDEALTEIVLVEYQVVVESLAITHSTLKTLLTGIDEFEDKLNRLQIIENFEKLVADLDNAEYNAYNYTSIIVLQMYYDDLGADLKALLADEKDTLDALRAEFEAAEFTNVSDVKTALDNAIVELKELIATNKDSIADLTTKVAELTTAYLAADEAIRGSISELNTKVDGNNEAINNLLTQKVAELNAALTTAIQGLKENEIAANTTAIAQVASDLEDAIAAITEAYEAADEAIRGSIETLESKVDANDAAINELLADKVAELNAALTTAIQGLKDNEIAANTAAIAQVASDLEDAIAAITEAYEAADEAIRGSISELDAKVDANDAAINELLADKVAELNAALTTAIQGLKDNEIAANTAAIAQVASDLESAIATLTEAYTAADNLLKASINELKTSTSANDQAIKDLLTAKAEELSNAISAAILALKDGEIDANADAIEQLASDLQDAINTLKAEIKVGDDAVRKELQEEIDSLNSALIATVIIFSIFTALLLVGVIVLELRKKNK